jgi:hypothetical protein
MYTCPSCGARSISFVRKWLSWSAAPARCSGCGVSCAIALVDASAILVGATLLVTLCGFAAAAVHAAYPHVAGVALAIAYYFWRQHRGPLMVIAQEETKTAKRSSRLLLLAFLFPKLFLLGRRRQ